MIEAQYRFRNEQRDARFFVVNVTESEITPPTEDEIKKEYDGNPSAYTAPEYRAVAVMKVEPQDVLARISLMDDELATGYEKYKADYFTPEKRTILQLSFPTVDEAKAAKEKLAAGADFLALAKERGFAEADVTFADKSKADFLDAAIAEAAFNLAENEVSEPIKGALATVLLKAVKITPEHQATLDEVKPQLSERLKMEKAREEIDSIYAAVEDARGGENPKFEDIAAKASIPFLLIPATDASGKDKDGKDLDMPHKADLLRGVFSSDVGVDNDALSLDNGYVWYDVREIIPSALKPFDAVKDQARAQVVADKLRTLAGEKAKALVDKLKAGATLDDLAKEVSATIQTAEGLKRGESVPSFGPEAVAALFAVPENGFTSAVEPSGKAAKVIQSKAVLLPAFDPASADAKAIEDRMKGQVANDVLFAYLGALQKEAGVKINETLWQTIAGTPSP